MPDDYQEWTRGVPPYPPALLELRHPPNPLYAIGDARVLDRQAIAIIGARRATPASLSFARRIARAVARAGACVVSGLAIGVDAAAHEGALDVTGGRTCAVLGGGIDAGAPPCNGPLRARIATEGLLLSEWTAGVRTGPWMFPHRNRVIAALARATVVVEAGEKSGTLHTINAAMQLGRTIATVPGPVDNPAFKGSNALLTHPGACILLKPEDALSLLSPRVEVAEPPPQFSPDEASVWDALANGAADVDTISIRAHLTVVRCLAAITSLELAGAIECDLAGEVRRR